MHTNRELSGASFIPSLLSIVYYHRFIQYSLWRLLSKNISDPKCVKTFEYKMGRVRGLRVR